MKAKDISGEAPGGARMKLASVLPLSTPLVVQFFPVYACNFTCKYCTFSIPKNQRGFISDKVVMDFDLYRKCVDELATFSSKVKTLRFVGMGEPLIHTRISDMVAYAVSKGVAERVEILTNASLLTHNLSDSLVVAGLDRIVVSLQGTTADKYREVSNINLDFDTFLENLRYLYENKGQLQIHFKIIDLALDGKDDAVRFYETFGDYCDTIGIEHAGPIYPGVAINEELEKDSHEVTQFGLRVSKEESWICPQPFFTLQINPDGNVVPCYSIVYPVIIGNCIKETIVEIWNGEKLREFRLGTLAMAQDVCDVCVECKINRHRRFLEDSLNNDTERLKKLYER